MTLFVEQTAKLTQMTVSCKWKTAGQGRWLPSNIMAFVANLLTNLKIIFTDIQSLCTDVFYAIKNKLLKSFVSKVKQRKQVFVWFYKPLFIILLLFNTHIE